MDMWPKSWLTMVVVDSDDDLLRHVYDNLKGQGTVEQIMAHEDVQRANPVRQMFPFPFIFNKSKVLHKKIAGLLRIYLATAFENSCKTGLKALMQQVCIIAFKSK